MQIVIAWTTTEAEVVECRRTDLGERPKMRDVIVPHAGMWLNKGTEADLVKARAYATTEGYVVFVYHGEKDPLGKAKREVLTIARCAA